MVSGQYYSKDISAVVYTIQVFSTIATMNMLPTREGRDPRK